jgi:DNA-binding NtrC family response regulator
MPARVVVVHDEPRFLEEVAADLRLAGCQVATFADPIAAWDALATAQLTEVLVTQIVFPPGKSNGVALARMARAKRKEIQVAFSATPEVAAAAEDLGTILPASMSAHEVVATVQRLLQRPRYPLVTPA